MAPRQRCFRFHLAAVKPLQIVPEQSAHQIGASGCVMGADAMRSVLAVSFLIDDGQGVWTWVIAVLGGIFVVEFVARFLDASSRRSYLRHHWLDVISAIPLIGGLRSLRLLRLLRLGAVLRVLVATEEITTARGGTGRHGARGPTPRRGRPPRHPTG